MTEGGSVTDNGSARNRRKSSRSVLWFILLSGGGIIAMMLGAVLHETLGLATPFLFSGSVYLLLNTQKEKLKRSTIYVSWSEITAFLGVLFLELGAHIDECLGGGVLLYLYIAVLAALFAFANIITSGEILKFSGIAKILVLVAVAWMFGRLAALELERVRYESHSSRSVQVQSPSTPPTELRTTTPTNDSPYRCTQQ